ncbi:VirE N-terminal domain-containing protein [Xylanibacter ruminicola]|uniref:VirE N-terminal domain-containing protein n=1 Tax=Xylanibacter ruminicola TaxID=839 RepID=A0A1H4DMK8_XYLRU|nr:BT4734/BF3469 family protein [Xylanibacter ruminicola]SEA73974.1 VirE N-terminal domain-containing protein [Xylanibacter ruminicola]
MFCYQRSFGLPTEIVTAEQFRALIRAPRTQALVKEAREALERGDKNTYDKKKKALPFVIFVATYDESTKIFESNLTGEQTAKMGMWRKQEKCRLNGLCVIDFDHIEGDVRQVWEEAYAKLSDEDKARILFVYVTPSGHGLKVVFMADVNIGNLIDNQIVFSKKLGLNPDEACKDASRGAFLTTSEDIIFIDEEKLITYENEEFGKRFNDEYHAGHSQPTINVAKNSAVSVDMAAVESAGENQPALSAGDGDYQRIAELLTYNGMPLLSIIAAWWKKRSTSSDEVSRHEASVVLARDLYIMTDRDKAKTLALLMVQPWVQEMIAERGEDVKRTVNNAADYVTAQENENAKKGKAWLPKISKEMKAVLEVGTEVEKEERSTEADDVYSQLPLDKWAEELQEMADVYPCMKELFVNVHPYKLPAVLFSSAALFGTLMTRAWYHFWFAPKIVRRLNYCIFIIGDPGAGKHMIEEFYKQIADPMIQADSCLIDAVNRYKEGRTERTTSTKAQKGEALKRPAVGIRVHPARTATGEFIRHMNAAIETIDGKPLNLHMFSFDSELDNVTKNNKGGDWKDREILELKAFHNEEDGQMYANQESVTGMFNVYWNFIYTGTPYALHRKVNQRNFGTGMSTRLAVIPLPDKGKVERYQQVIESSEETLKKWAYRLDKVAGEIPIEPLNDETYEWQTDKMEIAEFNGDKADRMLLKRIPYYGIGISLPFILMRHWDEWQEHHTLSMDETDKRFCRVVMDIQYQSQKFFFGEMAFNYFADQNKEFVVRKRCTRYDECFRRLPEEFKTQQFVEVFGISQQAASRAITRFRNDGVIEVVKYGVYKKVVSELP